MGSLAQLPTTHNTDDFNKQPLGEGFIVLATSAGNRLLFRSPAEANAYRINGSLPAQFYTQKVDGTSDLDNGGNFNTQIQSPSTD